MIDLVFQQGMAVALVFCRIGSAMMLLPGFGSPRIPMTVRLYLGLAISAALAAQLPSPSSSLLTLQQPLVALQLIGQEVIVGFFIGAMGSLFIHGVRLTGDVVSNCIGLGGIPGVPIEGYDPSGHISSLLTLTVTMAIFATDLHLQSIAALADTYSVSSIGAGLEADVIMAGISETLRDAFLLSLQLASPFIAFSLLSNLILGFVGRIAPKVSIYFSVTGLMALFGLWLLIIVAPNTASLGARSYGVWIEGLVQ
jgi:flagellar biosynthesis protein FliR